MARLGSLSNGLVLGLGVALMLAAPGCIKTPTKSAMMQSAPNLQDMTSAELRLKVHAFATRFEKTVEGAADKIIAQTDDPAIRRAALDWKVYAVPEVQKAAFHYDPLAGLIDVAALCGQMKDFFGPDGDGNDVFGPWQHVAVEASNRLDTEVWELGRSITKSGDVSAARTDVGQWVAENPIDDISMVRESTRALSARMATRYGTGAGAAIGGITETVADLSDRLTIYAASLPNQARWQAQVLAYDMFEEAELDTLGASAASVADSIDRIASTVELTPELIVDERAKTMVELDELTRALVGAIDSQRLATIEALTHERVALLEAVERERIAVLEGVHQERAATIEDGGQVLAGLVQDSFERAEGLVDLVFWRVAILLFGSGLGLLVVGLILVRSARVESKRG
jgi:hypothetical protein